jgi:hypothetical protein
MGKSQKNQTASSNEDKSQKLPTIGMHASKSKPIQLDLTIRELSCCVNH